MPFIVRFYFPATGEIAPSVNEVKVVSETIVMSCRDMDVHHVLAAFVEWYALLRSTGFRLLVTGCFCRVQEDSRQPTSTVRPRTLGIDVQRKCCAVLVSKFLLVARGFSRVYLLVCCAKNGAALSKWPVARAGYDDSEQTQDRAVDRQQSKEAVAVSRDDDGWLQ